MTLVFTLWKKSRWKKLQNKDDSNQYFDQEICIQGIAKMTKNKSVKNIFRK